jgi:hypothetical protein
MKLNPKLMALLLLIALVAIFLIWQGNRHSGTAANPADSSTLAVPSPRSGTSKLRESNLEADRLLVAEGANTDATVSQFPIKEYTRNVVSASKPAGAPEGEAYVHIPSAGRRISFDPNQIGEFPSLDTGLKDTVGVRLILADVKPGTPVRVVILDGGSFPSAEGVAQMLVATDWHGVAFEFTTSANIGSHRVLVQAHGQPSRILDFNAIDTTHS